MFVKNQEIIDRFSSYVQPTHFTKLTERCKSFLHIEQNQVNEGITLEQLVQRLGMYKNSTIITWGNMDMKVLRQCCQKIRCRFLLQVKKLIFRWSISAFGDQNQTGLWKAVQEYGKEGTGKHHCALDDAMTTLNIFKLVEKISGTFKNRSRRP